MANTKGLHDTEGWKSLETSFMSLQYIIKGLIYTF